LAFSMAEPAGFTRENVQSRNGCSRWSSTPEGWSRNVTDNLPGPFLYFDREASRTARSPLLCRSMIVPGRVG
jgi:hypothetical protein